MVDAERLHRLLRRVTDDLAVLRTYTQVPAEELLCDAVRLWHVKYVFITMLEGCIDAAHHVCAAEGYGPVDTNAEAMLVLARHGVVAPDQAQALAQAVRLRNVLVHGYADVDDRRVVAYLSDLDDIARYAADLAGLL